MIMANQYVNNWSAEETAFLFKGLLEEIPQA